MSFSTSLKTLVVSELTAIESLATSRYTEYLPISLGRTAPVFACFWDDAARTRLRGAAISDGSLSGEVLKDGRTAYTAYWQSDLIEAVENGEIAGVSFLTQEELDGLRVTSENQTHE